MAVKLQIRRGTSTEWGSSTEILSAGELVWASDTRQFKVGDGIKTWAQLEYVAGPTGATGAGVAAGGTAGQILSKIGSGTGTDYQTGWTSNFVSSINGSYGAITNVVLTTGTTFTGAVAFSGAGTLNLPATVSLSSIGSGTPSRYLAINSSGNLVLGSSVSETAIVSTLALRTNSGALYATTFSGTSLQLTGTGFAQTVLPSSTSVTGGNHSFYLPQLSTAPYSATLISNADSKTVSTTMLADNAVTLAKLADNSVTSDKIVDGTIVNSDISATAAIAVSKLSTSSITINSQTVSLGGSVVITAAPTSHASSHGDLGLDRITVAQSQVTGLQSALVTLTDGITAANTLANTKVASVTAGDSTITIGGTATAPTVKLATSSITINNNTVALGGSTTITAVPTAGSVVDASIVTGGLSPSKITGTAAVTGAANTFTVSSNVTPITIKGQGAGTPANLQEWWFGSLSTSAAAWVDGYGTLVSKTGINAGLVPSPITGVKLGILTVQPDGENSGKGLVIRRSGTGNVFEIQDAINGNGLFLMDYQGAIYSPGSDKPALVVGDAQKSPVGITLTSSSYDLTAQTFTFTSNTTTGLFNNARITFSNNFTGEYAVLNGTTQTMTYSGTGTGFTVPYQSDTAITTGALGNSVVAYATIPGQTVDIQKWKTVNASDGASGVDANGWFYSTRLYTKGVPTLAAATNSAGTISAGYQGYANTTADIVGRAIGVYDTTGKNQIFGNTTVGFGIGTSNIVTASVTQYGALQAYKQVAGTGTSAVLVARATSGTGNLQQWQYGSGANVIAKLDYQGNITLGYGNANGAGSATGNSTTGSILAPGGITTVYQSTNAGPGIIEGATGKFGTSLFVNGTFTIGGSYTLNAGSANFTPISGGAGLRSLALLKGLLSVNGTVASTAMSIDAIAPFTFGPNLTSSPPYIYSIAAAADKYNLALETSFTNNGVNDIGMLPRHGSRVRLYTSTQSGVILDQDDYVEASVNRNNTESLDVLDNFRRGPKAGNNYVNGVTHVRLVPIGLDSDAEIKTTDTVRVGAEGTALKRTWGGITNSATIPAWSSTPGTYSAGTLVSYEKTTSPTNIYTVYQRTSTAGTSTLAPPFDPEKWTVYVNYSISYQGSNVWLLTYKGPVAPSSVHLTAMDATRDIVCTLTEAPSISSGTVSIKFRARDIVGNAYIIADPLKIYWMAIE